LRLWAIAADTTDVSVKVLLLFQIIEIAYPDGSAYPEYRDPSTAPHPLSECKLLRDLVVHSGAVSSTQLKLYCSYLGLPALMHDITDTHYSTIIASKLPLMESEAKKAIERAL
jgi:hypothetical protein